MGGYHQRERRYLVTLDAVARAGLTVEEVRAVDARGAPVRPEPRWGDAVARGSLLSLYTLSGLGAIGLATLATPPSP
jgi:hypothetical protein